MPDKKNEELNEGEMEQAAGGGGASISSSQSPSQTMGTLGERSGELLVFSAPDTWFAYPYTLDHKKAPDFARTVDIHRKPGYDPCELFFDPIIPVPQVRAGFRLLQQKLGLRTRMDVIGLAPVPPS